METRERQRFVATYMILALLLNLIGRISSLSVTVNEEECIYEYVIYEGDTVSGNFVVVDHDIFWSADHPGIDFTVSILIVPNFTRSICVHEIFRLVLISFDLRLSIMLNFVIYMVLFSIKADWAGQRIDLAIDHND